MTELTHHSCLICGGKPEYQNGVWKCGCHTYRTSPSRGLKIEVNSIYQKTVKIKGIGTCTDSEIVIPEEIDGFTVTAIGKNAFANYNHIKSIVIPSTVESIGRFAFEHCNGLQHIALPDGIHVSDGAFYGCNGLTHAVIPSGISDMSGMFHRCDFLESAILSQGVTAIADYMFKDCTSLASIRIPESVTHIGEKAFAYCEALSALTYGGTVDQWKQITLGQDWRAYSSLKAVICSDGTVSLD